MHARWSAMLLVACLLLGTAGAAVGSGYADRMFFWDENNNGIQDSADIANGLMRAWTDEDYDDFYCWPDSEWVYAHGVLGPCVRDSVSRYLQVSYFPNQQALSLAIPIARVGQRVRLEQLQVGGGGTIILAGAIRRRGLHKIAFKPVDSAGAVMAQGSGRVRLTIVGEVYERPIAWDWRTYSGRR